MRPAHCITPTSPSLTTQIAVTSMPCISDHMHPLYIGIEIMGAWLPCVATMV